MRWDPSFFVYALLVFLMVAAAAAAAVGAAVSSSVSSSVLPFVTWVKNIATKKYGSTLLVYLVYRFSRGLFWTSKFTKSSGTPQAELPMKVRHFQTVYISILYF